MATLRVAVRVRPFNKRNSSNLKDGGKTFSYDFSYDSTDEGRPTFISQERIFHDLGSDVLKAAFEGFNTCLFAYGQTGSGKSYTMMGHTDDKGLIPRICEGLFCEISRRGKSEAVSFRTEVSYLEIYNERVQDLLKKKTTPTDGGLRVREHPRDGPYVEDLSKLLVHNHSDMEDLIILGNANRTTASTAMNDISSRSHAIFTISFTRAWFDAELPRETLSKIHLVDLAGSERADATLSTGTRLKEGANINKSLVSLGTVISALADLSVGGQSTKKKKQTFIPYRDSVLTWLLKDSLGGNSLTTMIATISPADVNYGETLSTLRYASRAKNIVNSPTVNEDSSVKVIRELQAEVTRLRQLLEEANQVLYMFKLVEEELHQNQTRVLALTKEWTSKWGETQSILQEETVALRKEGSGVVLGCQLPHLIGIDEDLLSTGIVLYYLKEGRTLIGSDEASCSQDIVLHGPGLLSEHCVLENRAGTVTLIPQDGALCSVNGSLVTDPCQLTQAVTHISHFDRFTFHSAVSFCCLQRGPQSDFSLPLTDMSRSTENLSKSIISTSVFTYQKIVALFWVNVAKCSHPEPCPGLLILAEAGLYTLTADFGLLVLFHHLPLLQLKEVHIGLAGHSLRMMGATEESILGVYTHSQQLTKELCSAILAVICPGDKRVSQHPLLHGDLKKLSFDWQACVPDLLLDAGLRICCQFQKSLAGLVYLLQSNMDQETVTLGEVQILLYTGVGVCISPSTHSEPLAQLLLTDTHLGLVQDEAVFHPTPRSVTIVPRCPQFHDLTLRQRSDVRCVLVHDEDERGAVSVDVILANVRGRGHPESVTKAATPPTQASNSSRHAEVWKLTFSCSSEAAFLINHLSNV
uniref:Kinesin-like protein n=1 Tax=Cyclopterus lumpus TaxID=8103 RepID=A0A8C3ADN0_CYCLU